MNINTSGIQSLGDFQHLQNQLQKNKSIHVEQANKSDEAGENRKLREASKDFQAIFIKQMLDSMRKTVQKNGLLDGGRAEKIFEDMLYDKYAKKMSETAELGLDKMLYNQLSQQKPSLDKIE